MVLRETSVKPIQSVERAILILSQFSIADKEFTLSELSARTQLKRTTCYGIAETLVKHRYLSFDSSKNTYKLGMAVFQLGSVYARSVDLRAVARPFIEQLSEKFNITVHLAVKDGISAVYIDKVGEDESFRIRSRLGKRAELFATAVSKVVLAEMKDEEIRSIISREKLVRYTSKTITEPDEFMEEIQRVRQKKMALDDQELEIGLLCMAAPVYSAGGKFVGVIGTSGTYEFMSTNLHSIRKELQSICQSIEVYLVDGN